MCLVSFDIDKAYDTTWKHRIITKLSSVLHSNNLLNFISNILKTRTFQAKVNNTLSNTFTQQNGIPQGSSISATLFLIAINDKCISNPVKYTLFADNLNIFLRSKQTQIIQNMLQSTINNISKWANQTDFKFFPNKSQSICFTKKRNIQPPTLQINGSTIPNKNTIKILGIIFDKKLNWKTHIKYLKKETSIRSNILKVLSHTTWG
jgi:hypothetical protein